MDLFLRDGLSFLKYFKKVIIKSVKLTHINTAGHSPKDFVEI
jgi:hypothetical protein